MTKVKYRIDTNYNYEPPYTVVAILETDIYDTREEAQKICDKLNEEGNK